MFIVLVVYRNGEGMLRPAACVDGLKNCSFNGVCAEHHSGLVCLCVHPFYGRYCEMESSRIPVYQGGLISFKKIIDFFNIL